VAIMIQAFLSSQALRPLTTAFPPRYSFYNIRSSEMTFTTLCLLSTAVHCVSSARSFIQNGLKASAVGQHFTSEHRRHLDEHLLAKLGLSFDSGSLPELYTGLESALQSAGESVTEGHSEDSGILAKQTQTYDTWAKSGTLRTICETGFNAGHSALRFLAQSQAKVFEFDLGSHDYAHTAERFLHSRFFDRLNVTWGDSTKTLPQFIQANPSVKCDLLIVDGGHAYEVAISDLKNFAQMTAPEHLLAIDDTPCEANACQGPGKAWQELIQHGCIEESEAVHMGTLRGFSVPCEYLASTK